MQEKKTGSKRGPGRPRTSASDPARQARERKRRQRERFARESLVKVEVMIPGELRERLRKAGKGQPLSDVGREAFRLWLRSKRVGKAQAKMG